jgi:hypothetical protein
MSATRPEGAEPAGVDRGRPGASARAEYERRRATDDRRREEVFGRYVAPVVKALTGEKETTAAWARGSRGEERVGQRLSLAVGLNGIVLHDRAIPGMRSNIDHIAIVPSGVWVIDTKEYHGRVQQRDLGGWFVSRPALFVNGQNRTSLIPGVLRQLEHVQRVVRDEAPLHATLCFNDAEWGLLGRPFTIEGVSVTWARRLADSLTEGGTLEHDDIRTLAARLAAAFPPYSSSHRISGPAGA